MGSSPHTRGAPRHRTGWTRAPGIIPAYAGSTWRCRWRPPPSRDHPRIRGEHSLRRLRDLASGGSSPHTRGALSDRGYLICGVRIIPAYAGSTPTPTTRTPARRDHPRIRGEHSRPVVQHIAPIGSSPHTRGAPIRPPSRSRRPGDHPRIRGEHDGQGHLRVVGGGSSPHTRGAHPLPFTRSPLWRIIPAYAGSTLLQSQGSLDGRDHPRIRGEHSDFAAIGKCAAGSSPHTRGALGLAVKSGDCERIIPAYAGSTLLGWLPVRLSEDHPRIRGEHRVCRPRSMLHRGSSPHTRGAPEQPSTKSPWSRIIPAYAGSTLGNPCNTKDRRRDYTSFPLPVTHPSGGGGS